MTIKFTKIQIIISITVLASILALSFVTFFIFPKTENKIPSTNSVNNLIKLTDNTLIGKISDRYTMTAGKSNDSLLFTIMDSQGKTHSTYIHKVMGIDPSLSFDKLFHIIDFNNDDHNDIAVTDWTGATGNVGYSLWLNRLDTEDKFVAVEEFNSLSHPCYSTQTKFIYSYLKGGSAGGQYLYQKFKWDKNNIVLVEQTQQNDISDEHKENYIWRYTKTKYEAGKGTILEDIYLPLEQPKFPSVEKIAMCDIKI